MENQELIKQVTEKAEKWLSPAYDAETQAEVKKMLENEDKTELIESFYKDLEFGTGGLRGIMGSGSNRMNIYTVGGATQGLSNYLNKNFKELKQISVVVGHDCRNNSRKFAEISEYILGQWHQGLFVRSPSSNTRDLICYSSSGMSERYCDYSFSQS